MEHYHCYRDATQAMTATDTEAVKKAQIKENAPHVY